MAGSHNLSSIVGAWNAATPNCPLGVGQSSLSLSGFIRVNAVARNSTVFTQTNNPLSNAFAVAVRTGDIQFTIRGTAAATYASPLVLGQGIHFGLTLSPTSAKVYVNGVVKQSINSPGITLANVNSIRLFTTAGTGNNFFVSDFAIWNGVELPSSVITDLCYRAIDPGSAPIPATSWWRLGGPDGTIAISGSAGLQDAIGSNHLSNVTGTAAGGVYNDDTLVFDSPIAIVSP